jgi:hypothetical protein
MAHIRQCLDHLNELRSLVIKRDDAALQALLEKIRAEADAYIANELRRQTLRKELAAMLGCEFQQVTLSRLETELPTDTRPRITQRKTQLKALTRQLRKEHAATSLLLSECARFNSMLLKNIFNIGKTQTLAYNCCGKTTLQADTGMMNLRF